MFNIYTSILKQEVAPTQTFQLTLKPTHRHLPCRSCWSTFLYQFSYSWYHFIPCFQACLSLEGMYVPTEVDEKCLYSMLNTAQCSPNNEIIQTKDICHHSLQTSQTTSSQEDRKRCKAIHQKRAASKPLSAAAILPNTEQIPSLGCNY